MNRSMLGSLLLIAALLLSSCTVILPIAEDLIAAPGQPPAPAAPVTQATPAPPSQTAPATDAATLAMANEQLGTLGTAMIQAGLLDILLTGGPYTILAPTDEAFAALDDETVASLSADRDRLAQFLQFHVIEGAYTLADLQGMQAVENLAGASLEIVPDEEGLRVGPARIVVSDILVPNGVVHVVDAILFPVGAEDIVDVIEQEPSLGILASLLEMTELKAMLHAVGPFTLLAPTDEAFADFFGENPLVVEDVQTLAAVIQYHIIPERVLLLDEEGPEEATYDTWLGPPLTFAREEGTVTVDGAAVVLANLQVANGVVHLIDRVLLPPEGATAVYGPELAELAQQLGGLDFLAQVFGSEALGAQLAELEAFTLFVPAEEAFAALSNETILKLMSDPEALTQVLQYHVLPQALLAADLATMTETMTLAGLPLQVGTDPLTVNGARFLATDIEVEGGVLHLIDAVLLPPESEPAEEAMARETEEAAEAETASEEEEAAEPEEQPEVGELEGADTAEPEEEAVTEEGALAEEEAAAPLPPSRQLSLVAMLRAMFTSGLLDDLEKIGPITIFGPSDTALNGLQPSELLALTRDPQALRALLERHIIPGTVLGADLAPGPLMTMSGDELMLEVDPASGALTVNGARLLWVDMRIGDAVIHIIDQVLLPAAVEPPLEQEAEPLEEPEEAVAEEPAELEPLLEPGETLATLLRREPRLELLASLVELANLYELLSQEGPLTLLAPTDAALAAIPDTVVLGIIRQDGLLVRVLQHHVLGGRLSPEEIDQAATLTSFAYQPLHVVVQGGELWFEGAKVVDVIEADNGRLYLIDQLILYPDMPLDVVGQLYAAGNMTEFLRLLELAGLAGALSRAEAVTLLAPTDAAFAELSAAQLEALTEDLEALASWLGRYILPGRRTAEELARLRSVETYAGERLAVRARRGNLFIGGTRVVQRNISAANGMIHAVDTVVLPRR